MFRGLITQFANPLHHSKAFFGFGRAAEHVCCNEVTCFALKRQYKKAVRFPDAQEFLTKVKSLIERRGIGLGAGDLYGTYLGF